MATFFDLECSDRKFIEGSEHNDWEGIICPKEPGHQRAGRRITELHIDIVSKKVADFSKTLLSDIVITARALKVIEGAGLTGFCVKPIQIHHLPKGLDSSVVPRLWEFVVTGQAGFAHPDSGIVVKARCEACGKIRYSAYERGIIVNESTYDGSDFFTVVEYRKHVLVSERAKNVIEESGLTNVRFVESSKLVWPECVVKP